MKSIMVNPNPKGRLKKDLKGLHLPKMPPMQEGSFYPSSNSNNKVVFKITMVSFYMSESKITNQQFCVFLNAFINKPDTLKAWFDFSSAQNPFVKKVDGKLEVIEGKETQPVMNVSWIGANAYGNWLSDCVNEAREEIGLSPLPNYRLPGEAEWEYVARLQAESKEQGSEMSKEIPVDLLHNEKSIKSIQQMVGNGAEWTFDEYTEFPYGSPKFEYVENNPIKVVKGGFVNPQESKNVNYTTRDKLHEMSFSQNVGFRLVMTYLGRNSGYEF
jgi:sulfatase modifying factor 1